MASQQAPPSIPPRPSRNKSPNPQAETPAIPPRPQRPTRAKSPAATLPSPSPSPEREPAPTTISPSTTLHAPVARAPAQQPAPPKSAQSSSASTPNIYSHRLGSEEFKEDGGIPQIGRRVPMHPNAGDVQAPTPAITPSGGWKKHVYREEWEMAEGAYGQARRETPYSMSSSDLNQVVAHSGGSGVGVDSSTPAVPDEEVGYLASEEYTKTLSRSTTPAAGEDKQSDTNREENDHSVIHLDPPQSGGYLRRGNSDFGGSASQSQTSLLEVEGAAEEGEGEDSNEYPIIAEDEALKRRAVEYMQPAISPATPRRPSSRPKSAANLDYFSDEKLPGLPENREFSHPLEALDALEEAEGAKPLVFEDEDESKNLENLKAKNLSVEKLKRPELQEHRFPSRDVWEEAPDSSQLEATVNSPPPDTEITEEDRQAQRTVPQRHHSNQPDQKYVQGQPHHHYEPGDEQEFERKQREGIRTGSEYRVNVHDLPEDDRLRRLLRTTKTDDEDFDHSGRRSSRANKFPSNDIWEDVPESLELTTTISPETEKERASGGDVSGTSTDTAPGPERPTTGASLEGVHVAPGTERPTTGAPLEGTHTAPQVKPEIPARPSIPSRPPQRERKLPPATIPLPPERSVFNQFQARPTSPEKKEKPILPDRPKPKVPARPVKPASMARTPSSENAASPAADKPKPQVPPRTGGKIAALKAGFLGDLESRLKLGPGGPPPKKEEEKVEEEKKPLEDARKSRARGPRGRKLPTKAEPTAAPVETTEAVAKSDIVGVWTVWAVDDELDAVVVGTSQKPVAEAKDAEPTEPTRSEKAPEKEEQEAGSMDEKPAEENVQPVPNTSTLPGVNGTAEQAIPATTITPSSPAKEQPTESAAKQENPTMIPTSEHPEDAFAEGEHDNREDALRALGRQESQDSEGPNTPLPSRSGSLAGHHAPIKRDTVPLERVDEALKGGEDVERNIVEGDT